jgi:hypothetical protein
VITRQLPALTPGCAGDAHTLAPRVYGMLVLLTAGERSGLYWHSVYGMLVLLTAAERSGRYWHSVYGMLVLLTGAERSGLYWHSVNGMLVLLTAAERSGRYWHSVHTHFRQNPSASSRVRTQAHIMLSFYGYFCHSQRALKTLHATFNVLTSYFINECIHI